ncbi:MAG: hypothetical protein HY843_08600 [Bdellovibrio sp.]|nr:hypothetical protein [Bdellovibrio sp.]
MAFSFISLLSVALSFAELPANYQNLLALSKQSVLWDQINTDSYIITKPDELNPNKVIIDDSKLPTKDPSKLYGLLFLTEFLLKSFMTVSDEMPSQLFLPRRPKLLHTYGTAAKVKLKITNPFLPYTGIFKTGAIGIVRLSLAKQEGPFTPGMAIKLLIDGNPSINLHVMHSVDGQEDDRNFFKHDFSNIIPPPVREELKILGIPFHKTVMQIKDGPESEGNLPLSQAASLDKHGKSISNPVTPYQIVFTPNEELAVDAHILLDFRTYLGKIGFDDDFDKFKDNTVLYSISVKAKDGPLQKIGELILKSPFIASPYEDRILFFQHANRR